MRYLFLLPFVLLAGLIIGGWAPREEVRTVRRELKELQQKSDREPRLNALTRMMRIPDHATKPREAMEPREQRAARVNADRTSGVEVVEGALSNKNTATTVPERGPRRRMSQEDLQARIDEAKELWKTRVEIARQQCQERLALDADQLAYFDSTINLMNERLYYMTQEFAETLGTTDDMTPEMGLRAANEMTTVLSETYTELHTIVGEERESEVSRIELLDFIDPGVAEPLIAVQEKLDRPPVARRAGRRRFMR